MAMLLQAILTGVIILGAGAYLAVHFRPRRKRISAGPVCGGCKGDAGCCGPASAQPVRKRF